MKIPPETVATVRFSAEEEGGTEHLPEEHLSAAVRLHGDDETWTMLFDFWERPEYDSAVLANIAFLAEEAPSERLLEGAQFEVLEVDSVVAAGNVVVDAVTTAGIEEDEPWIDGDRVGPVRHTRSEPRP